MMQIPSILSQIKLENSPSTCQTARKYNPISFTVDFRALKDYQSDDSEELDFDTKFDVKANISTDFLSFSRTGNLKQQLKNDLTQLKSDLIQIDYFTQCCQQIDDNIQRMSRNSKKLKIFVKTVLKL
ncbi:Hypothetical_protein [Hexamita inflata]|uniref:Hypothetical_protein n=1 Tax=Hexamita inflata TaxID=28002 RepID=A0AA86V2F8_9EUKA|nr:Hypothetical protein HINF_LOCUS65714 [Hexamita inflata]